MSVCLVFELMEMRNQGIRMGKAIIEMEMWKWYLLVQELESDVYCTYHLVQIMCPRLNRLWNILSILHVFCPLLLIHNIVWVFFYVVAGKPETEGLCHFGMWMLGHCSILAL